MTKFELNDKVKITNEKDPMYGRTGIVSSILSKEEKSVGVDIDWDGGDLKAYYYNEDELELFKDKVKEEDY